MNAFYLYTKTAHTDIYTLSLHDALPICRRPATSRRCCRARRSGRRSSPSPPPAPTSPPCGRGPRSEEHTSELQSQSNIVCRLLLEKKNIEKSSYLNLSE